MRNDEYAESERKCACDDAYKAIYHLYEKLTCANTHLYTSNSERESMAAFIWKPFGHYF